MNPVFDNSGTPNHCSHHPLSFWLSSPLRADDVRGAKSLLLTGAALGLAGDPARDVAQHPAEEGLPEPARARALQLELRTPVGSPCRRRSHRSASPRVVLADRQSLEQLVAKARRRLEQLDPLDGRDRHAAAEAAHGPTLSGDGAPLDVVDGRRTTVPTTTTRGRRRGCPRRPRGAAARRGARLDHHGQLSLCFCLGRLARPLCDGELYR